jgi:hypothetical protein
MFLARDEFGMSAGRVQSVLGSFLKPVRLRTI